MTGTRGDFSVTQGDSYYGRRGTSFGQLDSLLHSGKRKKWITVARHSNFGEKI